MGGHGAWWDDQEAQGAGGGASPALPRHRRRHGQDQELARDGGSILKEMLSDLHTIAGDNAISKN